MTATPMMQQWQQCKTEAKEALLLFRLGDFYEAFHDDAKLLSKELGLTLTQRQGIPMCGVPFHASDAYVDKLIAKGHKIAIAEQTEDPKSTKGLVRREITRIVTPGTVVHSQLISDKKNNYIASLLQLGQLFGLAVLDLTTGEFRTLELDRLQDLLDELYRIRPAEFLVPRKFKASFPSFFPELSNAFAFLVSEREDWQFHPESSCRALLSHFGVQTLGGFGLREQQSAIGAAGALLNYLKEELSLRLDHVISLQTDALSCYMTIDRSTVRNLELTESLSDGSQQHTLLDLIDYTATPMGARQLRGWLKYPLLSIQEIGARYDAIGEFLAHKTAIAALQSHLEKMRDVERLIAKVAARYASPRDLWSLGHSLALVPNIRQAMEAMSAPLLLQHREHLRDVSSIAHQICSSLVDQPPLRLSEGGLFKNGIHPELDRLRTLCKDSMSWMAGYQAQLRTETGIKTLKVGYTKAFGYYIEVSRAKGEQMPASFQRRQTLVNAERYVTDELKQFEQQVLTAEERAKALEAEMFEELRVAAAKEADTILGIAKAIARIDALLSLALAAEHRKFKRPVLEESTSLVIQGGRHPIIEKNIGFSNFIPNDTHLDPKEERQLQLITGPNMAGKSTYIRQVALIVILAQMGSYVPADAARIGIVDKVFSRIGASDDLARGHSTFMVEMSETANILNNATSRSLVILDEIGRGTSTYDGISIAWAVAEYLLTTLNKQAKTLFATHYWELTKLEEQHKSAFNVHVAVQETDQGIVFLRKVVPGGTDRSYGIHVAKLAGLPPAVLKRAETMLASLEEPREPKKKKVVAEQLPLFESPVMSELRKLDLHQTTPLQALQILADLKSKI